ncbi:bifunctional (p)ppGpp synthetase/guanosine-3',5'-bis(diphosphate) 3'-pyrophosphohydrolase [Alkalisalibacterium limincola]|uniref:GTP pyrophosphokinase n=1 Tax=Alkalisalibacterium limincola TaxID=2699169 RepID=A0A5C8KSF2_9GAMM|nr:bifunctional (p)ppGpp synthetase/guanosine-3',5'-bis(diphosphate) 3'-pyrophosphohydrolase [Alkalisalibacterium limincola]TXK62634.1 bifunctional (p)ppGpp synthetase/guanosine-3',5'-bis(diphosphate) 3'-pyrophosphohydrolase [Alkalisalibacterium limincola]
MASLPTARDNPAAWLEQARPPGLDAGRREALLAALGQVPGPRLDRLAEVLELLGQLHADTEVLAAAVADELSEGDVAPLRAVFPALDSLLQGLHDARQVWGLHDAATGTANAEGLRRLLLALIRDLRLILVLLARQLVDLRHAGGLPEAEREAMARLSADIHAPLANRLGIWQLKWELEDLAFRYLQPDTYRRIARLLDEKRADREAFIAQSKQRIAEALAEAGIEADVAGRPKHIYSIWKKMSRKDIPFSELYDVRAVRILVPDLTSCYAALGVVHSLWTPVPSEFDDYIAKPKGNDYRSLHTAVVGPEGKTLEIQIRTHEMHAHAELGVAAHWRYKEGGSHGADASFQRKVAWMRQLLEGADATDDAGGEKAGSGSASLAASLDSALVEDRVYLLTPRGEVVDLPKGSTVLDFAYYVHTEVGHRCIGAKVDGRIVPLTHRPGSGARVEILTGKEARPRRDWLQASSGFLASARARDKVRAWFHRLDRERNLHAGRELLEKELKRMALAQSDLSPALEKLRLSGVEELHLAIALGDVSPAQVARALHDAEQERHREEDVDAELQRAAARVRPPRPGAEFIVEGVGNLLTQLAKCCQPVAGDPIVGYLTRGRGLTVHRAGCASLQRLAARHPERVLSVEWGRSGGTSYGVDALVVGADRRWLLKDLTTLIAQSGVHVLSVNSSVDSSRSVVEIRFGLKVDDFEQLSGLLGKLVAVPGVYSAQRIG